MNRKISSLFFFLSLFIISIVFDYILYDSIIFLIFFVYVYCESKKNKILINRNTAIIFSLLLLYSLVSYYYIVELTDHQSYITNDDNIRLGIIHYGFLMCNSLLLGSAFGIFFYSNNKINLNFEAIFLIKKNENVILILAWIPIIINLILYLFFFSGREYVFVHVSGAGFLGKLMNTKFLESNALERVLSNISS